MKKKEKIYVFLHGYGEYGGEVTVRANDIFKALKKAADIIKERMLKKGFEEKDGCDISLRMWRFWE